jgi:DmsE family decaheme c-type cytochrome
MRNLAGSRLPLLFGFVLLTLPCWAGPGAQGQSDSGASAAQAKTAPAAPANKSDAQPASPEVCKACHVAEYDSWEKSPHWKTMVDKKADPIHQGCQGCHGSVAAHLADPTDTSKLFKFETATAKEINSQCLTCHAKDMEHAHALNSIHAKNDVACTACHSPHHAKQEQFLLAKAQPELCYTCHLAQKPQFQMPFHHRVNEGLVQCTDCHNPHGTVRATQLRASSTQDVACLKCHTDKQGPFTFEHEVVKVEGCTACHTPHGSPNPKLLKVSDINILCLQCHTASFANAPGAPSFHNQSAQFQACTLCHTQIHGSNVDRFFFR